jgi:hypothetical protein
MKLVTWIVLAVSMVACMPEQVETVTLTPETPEIAEVLRAADARWEAAGVAADRIVIGSGGAPVRLVPDRYGHETRVVGQGGTYTGVRWIELLDLHVGAVTHELGHVLGINVVALDAEHIDGSECDVDAPNRPIMCEVIGEKITACSVGDCTAFLPEVQ